MDIKYFPIPNSIDLLDRSKPGSWQDLQWASRCPCSCPADIHKSLTKFTLIYVKQKNLKY